MRGMLLQAAGVCSLALAVFGCDDKKPPVTPVAKHEEPVKVEKTQKDDDSQTANVNVDDKIAKLCDLPEARFSFDSSALNPQAKASFDKLASCFKDGAGKGHNMNIVGHADPRGSEDYNFALGQRRAGAVAGILKRAGLSDDRYATSSRGALDATGSDEAGWARDRKVEILLAQ